MPDFVLDNAHIEGNWWQKQSLRTQLFITFVGLSLLTFCLIGAVIFGVSGGVNSLIVTESQDVLTDSININSRLILNETASVIESFLRSGVQSFVGPYAFGVIDAFRTDYSFMPVNISDTYYDYDDAAIPLSANFNSRINRLVFDASTFYITGADNITVSSRLAATTAISALIPLTVSDILRRGYHQDSFIRTTYATNTQFLLGYIGYEDQLFIKYPGYSTTVEDPNRLYDPTERPWYIAAEERATQQNNLDPFLTDPYIDAFGNGLLISIVQPIVIPVGATNVFIGVAGSDWRLTDIQSAIENVATGIAVLLNVQGDVIAAPGLDQNSPTVPQFNAPGIEPTISQSLFDSISSSTSGSRSGYRGTFQGTNPEWLVSWESLLEDQYRLVIFVEQSRVDEPVSETRQDTNGVFVILVVVILAVLVAIIVFVVCSVIYLTHQFTQPIVKLTDISRRLANNIGQEGNIFSEQEMQYIQELHTTGIAEAAELGEGFAQMAQMYHDYEQKRHNIHPENPFQNINQLAWAAPLATPQQNHDSNRNQIPIPFDEPPPRYE